MKEFNGYNFDDKKTRNRMKYLVVSKGSLDLNKAYGFKSKRELNEFLSDDYHRENADAVFEVKVLDV